MSLPFDSSTGIVFDETSTVPALPHNLSVAKVDREIGNKSSGLVLVGAMQQRSGIESLHHASSYACVCVLPAVGAAHSLLIFIYLLAYHFFSNIFFSISIFF